MRKPLKFALIALGAVVALLVAAAALIAATFDPNDYKPQIIDLVQQKKQRTLAIPGRIELSFLPTLGAKLGAVSISEHRSSAPFASVESARVSLALMPLLRKQFVVDRIEIDGLRANLKRFKDGRMNIDDLLGDSKPAQQSSSPDDEVRTDVAGITMRNAVVTFNDERDAKHYEATLAELRTGRIAPGIPGEVEMKGRIKSSKPALDAALELNGGYSIDAPAKRYAIKALKARLDGTLDKAPLSLQLDVPQLDVGERILAQKIEARLKQTQGIRSIDAVLTLPAFSGTRQEIRTTLVLALDGKQGDRSIKAAANGTLSANLDKRSAALDIAGKLDQSGFNAKLWVDKTEPLAIRFDVALDALDVDRYRSTAAASPAQDKTAPDTPIDLSALKTLNASGNLKVGSLQVSGLKLTNLTMGLRATGGRMDLSPLNASLYQGSTSGSVSLMAASPPRFAVKQTLSGVSLGPLLQDLTGKQPIEGRGRMVLDVSTQGALVSTLKKGLAGSAQVELRDGAVRGVNLGQIVRMARGTGTGSTTEKTDFSELKASFRIAGGVARNDDLMATSPLFQLSGAGNIDIGNDHVDYLMKASVTDGTIAALQGKTIPVRLRGPFNAIGYSVDVGSVATEAVKQKIEKSLGDKLKGLFGR